MKVNFILSTLLAVFCATATAQISINSTDFPAAGSSFRLSLADTLLALDPEPTGEAFTWDFSFLEPLSQSEENWVTPFETNILYFFLFGTSNLAQEVSVPEIPGLELTDAFNFYQRNSGNFSQTGLAGLFTGIPIVISFEDADRIAAFPLNYGDTDSDASAFEFEVPTIAALREERQRESEVDGWGTLITPFGSFEVLRHKSIVNIRDSLSGSLGEFVLARQTIEYRWLGAGSGMPLLQIDVQEVAGASVISRIAYQDSLRSDEPPVGLQNQATSGWSLSPNPTFGNSLLRGQLNSDAVLAFQLLDASGRLIKEWPTVHTPAGAFAIPLDLSGCAPGLHWLRTSSLKTTLSGQGFLLYLQPILIH